MNALCLEIAGKKFNNYSAICITKLKVLEKILILHIYDSTQLILNFTSWIRVEQRPVRISTARKRLALLRMKSSKEHLRYTLVQKDSASAQTLRVVQSCPSSCGVQLSSSKMHEKSRARIYYQFTDIFNIRT